MHKNKMGGGMGQQNQVQGKNRRWWEGSLKMKPILNCISDPDGRQIWTDFVNYF